MEAGLINMGLVWLTQRALHRLPASILNGTEWQHCRFQGLRRQGELGGKFHFWG